MDYVDDIVALFGAVFDSQKEAFGVDLWDIKNAIGDMGRAYLPNPNWEEDHESNTTRYDAAGHRCAYLHKYAMIHTGLVCEVLQQVLKIYNVSHYIETKQSLRLCSLGSGPGTDIVALMLVLCDKFEPKQYIANLIDWSGEWATVFDSIVHELRTKNYSISKLMSNKHFNYKYLEADLLDFDGDEEYDSIRNADIITMIKFISAAACKDTRSMVKEIFRAMKPGAMLLFIDNAAGGFYKMLQESAKQCGLESVFGPSKHYDYEEPKFKFERYGSTSQYKTKVSVEMWKKPGSFAQNTTNQLRNEFFSGGSTNLWARGEYVRDFNDDYPSLGSSLERERAVYQCAQVGNHEQRNYGLQSTHISIDGNSFDEVDHIRPQNIRLRSDNPSTNKKKDSGCCLIM